MTLHRRFIACSMVLAAAGCTTPTPPALHTRWAAEVIAVAGSDAPAGGAEHGGNFEDFPEALSRHCGVSASGPGVATLALLRFSYYWHNGSATTRETLRWFPVQQDLDVAPGMLVAVEALAGRDGPDSRCPWVAEVLAADMDRAQCRYVDPDSGTAVLPRLLYGGLGPPGSASLDCPGLGEGWEKRPFGLYGATVLTRTP